MTPEFRIIEHQGQLRVRLPDGALDARAYRVKAHAAQRLAQLQKLAMRRERPCLTCRRQFLSEGPHHRMCGTCRRGSAMDPYQIGRRNGVA